MIRVALLAIATALVPFAAAQAQENPPAIPHYGHIVPIEGLAEMPDPALRYRVVFSITEAVPADEVNHSLEKVARYLNLLAAGGVVPNVGDIVAVVHGPATPIVGNNPDNPNLTLIAALQEAGVTVAICGQAMKRAKLSADDLAPGVRVDAAAITTLTNLQLRGWAVVYD